MSQPSFTPAPPGPFGGPSPSVPPQFLPPQFPPAQFPPVQSPPAQFPPAQSPPPQFGGPGQFGPGSYRPALALQRPAVIAISATMTVTASLQWICALSFAWLVATAGASTLSVRGSEGGLYHLLHRFHLEMVDGLAWPLYGCALLAFFAGFGVLAPRPWTRWSLTAIGVVTLGWSAWWLQDNLIWWLAPALYVVVACLILWTPGASRWYRQHGQVDPHRPF